MFALYVQLADMAQRAGLLPATVLALFLVLTVSLPYLALHLQILRFPRFVIVAQQVLTPQPTRLNAYHAPEDDMEPAEVTNVQALVLRVDLELALQINALVLVKRAPILQTVLQQLHALLVLLEHSASGWVSRQSLRLALESLLARQANMHSLVFHLQTLRVTVFVLSVQLASTDQELDSPQVTAQAL